MNGGLLEIYRADGKPEGWLIEEVPLAMEKVAQGYIGDKVEVHSLYLTCRAKMVEARNDEVIPVSCQMSMGVGCEEEDGFPRGPDKVPVRAAAQHDSGAQGESWCEVALIVLESDAASERDPIAFAGVGGYARVSDSIEEGVAVGIGWDRVGHDMPGPAI